MNTTIIAICAICLTAAILLEKKYRFPLGISCMAAALVISCLGLGISASEVVADYFPGTIVLPLILAMAYFTLFTSNGTSQILACRLIRVIRGNMKLFPWTLFVLSSLLYTFLDGSALRYVIAPMVFSIAETGGLGILMAVSVAYLPFVVGSLNPFVGIDAATRVGILTGMGLENGTGISLAIWLQAVLLLVVLHFLIYLVTRSWAVPDCEFHMEEVSPEMTPQQKQSMKILGITVLLFVVPPVLRSMVPNPFTNMLASVFSSYLVFTVGILLILLCGLEDWNTMVRRVALKPVIMIIGVTFLIKTAQQAGLQELCTRVAASVPHWMIGSVLLIISSVLSFFFAAPAVQPMLFPMAAAMADTPAQAVAYLVCATLGLAVSGVSPISNSGAAFLSTVAADKQDRYAKKMFFLALMGPLVLAALTATGILGVTSKLFAHWYY